MARKAEALAEWGKLLVLVLVLVLVHELKSKRNNSARDDSARRPKAGHGRVMFKTMSWRL